MRYLTVILFVFYCNLAFAQNCLPTPAIDKYWAVKLPVFNFIDPNNLIYKLALNGALMRITRRR